MKTSERIVTLVPMHCVTKLFLEKAYFIPNLDEKFASRSVALVGLWIE
jgi:tRNA A-37 threonylcarbamoyl transferase component Bud32